MTLLLALVLAFASSQTKPQVNTQSDSLALRGYDVVAYFIDGRAVRGLAQFEYRWSGARWQFASAAHRDEFMKAPQRYAPQFGGYCAWAVSQGYLASGDPKQWKIVDGKLYLNFNARAKELWEADQDAAIERGNANWPGVLAKNQDNP